ncbi:MAG: TerC family protein [Acetobacteraceae bacterium]
MEYEIFSTAFLSALLAIVLLDLVLAGDNALIIGLVARNLPRQQQKQVIFWGTFGAVAIRAAMAVVVVYILAVPGFMLAGGLALVWIARKLLMPEPESGAHAEKLSNAPVTSLFSAIRTVVIADAVMGIDNVIAIGGAAKGSILLLVLGLAISVPIIVWGSNLVIRLVNRFPSVILLGSAVLCWTAYSMLIREPMIESWLQAHAPVKMVLAILIFSIALAPWLTARLSARMQPIVVLLPALLVWLVGFEVAASVWHAPVSYLSATDTGAQILNVIRWTGWIPLAAAFLWLREQRTAQTRSAVST